MILQDLLEARREPELNNVRISDAYRDILQYRNDPNAFVSFHDLDKLGVNPESQWYTTPLGVYAYSVSAMTKQLERDFIPFGGHRKLISLFRISGNILDLQKPIAPHYLETIKKKYCSGIAVEVMDDIEDSVENACDGEYPEAEFFWKMTKILARLSLLSHDEQLGLDYIDDINELNFNRQSAARWNKVLRDVGIDAVEDNGGSVIHHAEPWQVVILNPSVIKMIKRFDNPRAENREISVRSNKQLIQLLNKVELPEYDQRALIDALEKERIVYVKGVMHNNPMIRIHADIQIYGDVDIEDIKKRMGI